MLFFRATLFYVKRRSRVGWAMIPVSVLFVSVIFSRNNMQFERGREKEEGGFFYNKLNLYVDDSSEYVTLLCVYHIILKMI